MLSGFGGMIAQGMAFGTGSAIAHRAVGAVAGAVGGGDDQAAPGQAPGAADAAGEHEQPPCQLQATRFYECLDGNGGNISACQVYFDAMSQCQKDDELRKQYV